MVEQGDFETALEKMKILYEKHPDLETYLQYMDIYERANVDIDNNKYLNALEKFRKIVRTIPNHYQSWGNMGICYQILNKPEKARECLEKALQINPEYEVAKMNLENYNLKHG